jgi:hypothetical protein
VCRGRSRVGDRGFCKICRYFPNNCNCNYKVALAMSLLGKHNCLVQDPKYVDAWGCLLRLQSQVVARIEEDLKKEGETSLTW